MADHVLGSDRSDGMSKKSELACESSWMARWTHIGSETAGQDHIRFSLKSDNGDEANNRILLHRSEIAAKDRLLSKRSGDVSESRNVDDFLEEKVNASLGKTRPFPMFNAFQHKESIVDLKNDRSSVCSRPILSCSDNSIDAMRIFATSGSVQEHSRKPFGCSQTTRHFMITGKTDIDVSMKLKGKMCSEFLDLSPDLRSQDQQGIKLQPIGSSADSEGVEISSVKNSMACTKNDSSAETDILDLDNFLKNRHSGSGMATSPSNKAVKRKQNSSACEIPDVNQEPPVVPDKESSKYSDKETSTTKTQSMNVEHFVSNIDQQSMDPSHRWFKRLKKSASNSSDHRTKSLTVEEALPSEKVNDFLTRIMKCRNPSPKHGEAMASETLGKNSKNQDITLLHPWIQRWCRNKQQSPQKTEPEVACAPESSNGTPLDKFQKKQFPSIAAMALMGKALNGFSPSEFRKTGSLTVWKTRVFR